MTGRPRGGMGARDAWDLAIPRWQTELRAAGYSPATLRLYTFRVREFALTTPSPAATTRSDLIEYLARPHWQPETRKSARTALVSFFGWASAAGVVTVDPAERLPKVRIPAAEPRPASDEAIREALAKASDRVRLMVLLGAVCGLRRAEIAGLHTTDLRGQELAITGKGGRRRVIDLPPDIAATIRDLPEGWVFPGPAGHMTPGRVGVLITRALPPGVSPHMLRHAAATALHDLGLSELDLQRFLGHASVATTARYVRVRSARTADAMATRAESLAGAR